MVTSSIEIRSLAIFLLAFSCSLASTAAAQQTIDAAERDRRSALFDDSTGNLPKLDQPQRTDGGYGEVWERAGLPSFPVTESDLVVVGKVSTAQSFFSKDHTRIYTEFVVIPEQALKGENRSEYAVLSRGGSILAPSGNVISYRGGSHNTGILTVGARYVLFLQIASNTDSYFSIKAWQLLNGHPRAIEVEDLRREAAGETHYSAWTEEEFVTAVKNSANH